MDMVSWTHRAARAETALILPDGCRDILVRQGPGQAPRVIQTGLDLGPRHVTLRPGEVLTGFRMPPGRAVPEGLLMGAGGARDAGELASQGHVTAEIEGLVALLAQPGATLIATARSAGVSVRSLQRHLARAHLPSPDHWIALARARRAARALGTGDPLARIATEAGYADQAHMTRAFRRWFGLPPARLRRDPALVAQLSQPGLGGWTTEQISIR